MHSITWIAHEGHSVSHWTAALRRELVAAYRRGSMDAEGCLRTYRAQGERAVLPVEAVAYLAARAVLDRASGTVSGGAITVEALRDQDERELADLLAADPRVFVEAIEAGHRFFFPGRRHVG